MRKLNKKQIKFFIENCHLSNQELAKKFNISPRLIANYKTRARKLGIDIPRQKRSDSIDHDLLKIAEEIKLIKKPAK